jgi:hypothetical protein
VGAAARGTTRGVAEVSTSDPDESPSDSDGLPSDSDADASSADDRRISSYATWRELDGISFVASLVRLATNKNATSPAVVTRGGASSSRGTTGRPTYTGKEVMHMANVNKAATLLHLQKTIAGIQKYFPGA